MVKGWLRSVKSRYAASLAAASRPNLLLAVLVGIEVLSVVGVAVLGTLWMVLAALWLRGAAGAVAEPIRSAWLNRNLEPRSRATVISMNGQLDAVGQLIGGPPLGALANRTSTGTALVVSAVLLAPAVGLYARLRARTETGDPEAPAPERT